METETEGGERANEGEANPDESVTSRQRQMAPNTRSGSLKFEQTTDGDWRVIEGGTARWLTTDELNEFADNFTEARLENEALTKEKGKLEELMAQKDVQHHEELQEKDRALEAIAVGSDEHDERRGHVGAYVAGIGRQTVEEQGVGGITDEEKIMATNLGPITDVLSRLTEQVDMLAKDGVSEAKSGHTGKRTGRSDREQQEPSRTIVDGRGGMRIGEANRLYRDNMMAVVV
jgi:hypothetical protein